MLRHWGPSGVGALTKSRLGSAAALLTTQAKSSSSSSSSEEEEDSDEAPKKKSPAKPPPKKGKAKVPRIALTDAPDVDEHAGEQ